LAFRFPDCFLDVFLLIGFRVGTSLAGQGDIRTTGGMDEVPMAPLSSAIHKSLFFKIGNELADFARHGIETTPTPMEGKAAL
jgi:hypothetical protein